MPRIYNEDNDALDFCACCFPSEEEATRLYGETGNHSYNENHPDYDDCDYDCENCKKPLTSKDN